MSAIAPRVYVRSNTTAYINRNRTVSRPIAGNICNTISQGKCCRLGDRGCGCSCAKVAVGYRYSVSACCCCDVLGGGSAGPVKAVWRRAAGDRQVDTAIASVTADIGYGRCQCQCCRFKYSDRVAFGAAVLVCNNNIVFSAV